MKEKKRYLVFNIIKKNESTKKTLQELTFKIRQILGLFESANAGILSVEIKKNKAILRVNNKYVDKVIASTIFIQKLNDEYSLIKPLLTTGLLNKARQI